MTPTHPSAVVVGVGFSLLLSVLGIAMARKPMPRSLEPVMPLMGIVLVAILRYGAGPEDEGVGLLVLIPVLWLSAFGSRRELAVALGLVALLLAAPILVVGGSEYPASDLRHVGVIVMLASFVGLTIQGLVHDIHAQRVVIDDRDAAIVRQAEVTQAIVHSAFDAIVTLDADGRIIESNDAAALLLGRSVEDLAGADFIETCVASERRSAVRAGLGRMVHSGSTDRERRFETIVVRPDGASVPVEVTTTTTDGPDGVRVHAFARDISERRRAEAAAAEHRADLGRLLSVASAVGRGDGEIDGRTAICVAAQELAGADMALFFELNATREALVESGRSGEGRGATEVALSGKSSVTATVFSSGRADFIPDLGADPRIDPTIVSRLGATSALFQPIVGDRGPVGVLVVYWLARQDVLPERIASIVALFAAQAAATIERGDLMTRLEALSRTDALTGAANRRSLEETIVRELRSAERSGRPVSVMMLDLDHFKAFNDSRGHQAGDRMLVAVTRAWQAELRPSDTLARYGGEEFLTVLPDCDLPTTVRVATRLRAAVPGAQTVSVGTATWDGTESSAELIGRADAALYEAKRSGRDRVVAAGAVGSPAREPVPS
jgi:diguanylate cyclase (GGDEF)-like protein/PAS domain S-box-containing protein